MALLGHMRLDLGKEALGGEIQRLKESVAQEKPEWVLLDVCATSAKMDGVQAALAKACPSYHMHALIPFNFSSCGLPACGQRLLYVAGLRSVSANVNAMWVDALKVMRGKDFALTLQSCLAKAECPRYQYCMAMAQKARAAEQAGLPKKKQKTEEDHLRAAFLHGWLPSESAGLPSVTQAAYDKLPKQGPLLFAHACVLSHKMGAMTESGSSALLLGDASNMAWKTHRVHDGSLPDLRPTAELLCLQKGGHLRSLVLEECLAAMGYPKGAVLLSLLRPGQAKHALAEVTPLPVAVGMAAVLCKLGLPM